jgi:hypothetical protein
MTLRRLTLILVAGITLIGSGAYLFIYLYRWEWNRAQISGLFFLGAEIAIVAWVMVGQVHRVLERLDSAPRRRQAISGHLRSARSEPSNVFAWLKPDASRTNVFIPILMGAGLILSGLAWVVERIGRATAGATADASVSAHLARLGPPAGGFLDDSGDPLRGLRAPAGAPR